jgi:acyl-CoA thioesterase FadM
MAGDDDRSVALGDGKSGTSYERCSGDPCDQSDFKTGARNPHRSGGTCFEGKWFVYSMVATYQDTNSVGNVYFGMYPLYVGKTRELFFNAAMPDFDLKTTKFYILTRSFEHKFVRETREFDTITVKIKVAEANRKFCTLEHQIFGSEGQLLGKGKQSLLFVSAKDYGLLDIPSEVYTAFMKYL